MNTENKSIVILTAEDDPDDIFLTKEAIAECHLTNDLYFVSDGEELLDYLHRRKKYTNPKSSPRPSIILLDLNMPKIDGREALAQIKKEPKFKNIPIIVFTTSTAEEDVTKAYDLGANSFITKPITFKGLVNVIKMIENYWFEIVRLPKEN